VTDSNPDAPSDFGEFAIQDGVRVDDLFYDWQVGLGGVEVGDSWGYLAGLLNYANGTFKIAPRDAADFSKDGGGGGSAPDTIQDVQMGGVPVGTVVTVDGVVSHTDTYGFYVQEPEGGAYSGVYAYYGSGWTSEVTVARGDLVEVTGEVTEYFDFTEVDWYGGGVVRTGVGVAPAPAVVATSDLATDPEPWEGVLVSLDGPEVTDLAPDAPDDFGMFTVQDGVRVDDTWYDIPATFPTMVVGSSFVRIDGIVGFSFGDFKVQPRDAADVGTFTP
jgi:hypothetical protein